MQRRISGAEPRTSLTQTRSAGYGPCFGVTHVDRKNGFVRTPKDSAFYLKEVFAHLTATKGGSTVKA